MEEEKKHEKNLEKNENKQKQKNRERRGREKLNEGMKQIFKIDNVKSQLKVRDTV